MKNYIFSWMILLSALLIMGCSSTRVQKYWTRGKVVNSEDNPVSGVRVTSKSREKHPLITDNSGRFNMKLKESDTLVLMTPGNEIFMVPIKENKRPVFTISDEQNSLALGEGTYNALTGPQKDYWKDWFASHQIQQQNKEYFSMIDMVREELSNVFVQGNQIYVRGPNTIRGTNPVMILVDGVWVNSLLDVNPHNVKSLELVRSGYSTSPSGESIGGVLKITTKNGL